MATDELWYADLMCGMPQLVVLGRSEASMLLRAESPHQVTAVISIHGHSDSPCEGFDVVPQTLELIFDDIDIVDETDPVSVYRSRISQRKAQDVEESLVPPSLDHIRQAVEFATRIKDIQGTLLCHCFGGVSRSPAVAIICLVCWMGRGHEREAVELIKAIRPAATPHAGIISLGDEFLKLNGRLNQAVEDVMGF